MASSSTRPDNAPQVLPYRYDADARAAVELLVNVVGFTEITAVRDDEGKVWHADLSTGDGLVMDHTSSTALLTAAATNGSSGRRSDLDGR